MAARVSSSQRLQVPRTRTRFRPGESETDGPTRDAWQATHADMPSLSPSRRPPSALECATLCSATTPNSLFTLSRSRKSHNLNEALGPAFWTRVGPGLVIVFSLGLPGFWGRAQLHRHGLGLVAWRLFFSHGTLRIAKLLACLLFVPKKNEAFFSTDLAPPSPRAVRALRKKINFAKHTKEK